MQRLVLGAWACSAVLACSSTDSPSEASPDSGGSDGSADAGITDAGSEPGDASAPDATGTRPPPIRCAPIAYSGKVHDVVAEGLVIDSPIDQTQKLQAIIDAADDGDVIFFPGMGGGRYLTVNGPVSLNHPVVLLGTGDEMALELRSPAGGSYALAINSDHVTLDGLWLTGSGYGDYSSNEGAITWGKASATDFRTGITIRKNTITDNPGQALGARYWADVLVECNRIERVTYAAVFLSVTRRVVVRHNDIRDVGDNVGHVRAAGTSGAIIAYPIVVTSAGSLAGSPASQALIYDNYLQKAEWQGIHNHGCEDFVAFDNQLVDQTHGLQGVAYAGSEPSRFEGQIYLNNTVLDTRKYAAAITIADGALFVGNRIGGTHGGGNDIVRIWGNTSEATVYGNSIAVTTPLDAERIVRIYDLTGPNTDYYVGRNSVDGIANDHVVTEQTSGSAGPTPALPAAPEDVRVTASQGGTWLTWSFGSDPHDSFEVEHSLDGVSYEPVAFRPPVRQSVTLELPSNPNYEPFNPLEYFLSGIDSGWVRIRANYRLGSSPWVTLPVAD